MYWVLSKGVWEGGAEVHSDKVIYVFHLYHCFYILSFSFILLFSQCYCCLCYSSLFCYCFLLFPTIFLPVSLTHTQTYTHTRTHAHIYTVSDSHTRIPPTHTNSGILHKTVTHIIDMGQRSSAIANLQTCFDLLGELVKGNYYTIGR